MENIGEVKYQSYEAQKCEIREQTEKSINSLFEKGVITQSQKQQLLQMYLSGDVSFGDDGLTEEEAQNFTSETFTTIENAIKGLADKFRTKTMYIVQYGDTPQIIAQKMGLTGDEAKRLAQDIKATAQRQGLWYKYGLRVGDMIQINGNYQDKIDELKQNGEYLEETEEINNNYNESRRLGRRGGYRGGTSAPTPPEDDEQPKTPPEDDEQPKAPPEKPKQPKTFPTKPVRPTTPPVSRTPEVPRKPPMEPQRPSGSTEAQKASAKKVYDEAMQIVKTLGKKPSPNDPILKRITPQNVTFVIKMYHDTYGKHLSRALIENGDKKGTIVYNRICQHLCTRAKQLGVNGIYYGDAQKCVNNPGKLYDWLNVAYPKILEAEKKNNPAYVNNADYETSRKRVEYEDTTQLRKDSVKIARELYEALHDSYQGGLRAKAQKLWDNKDNSVTKGILKQITPSNVAFVVQTYAKNYKTSLAEDINSEWIGLNVKDIKEQLCAKLVTQAKKLRIAINTAYQNITDIKELAAWMNNVSKAIITAMDGQSSVLPSDNTHETVTERPGGGKIKTITNGNMFIEAGISKIVEEYDNSGNKIQATVYFKDGKEVLEKYGQNDKTGKTELKERTLIKRGTSSRKPQSSGITEPLHMEIKLPSNANENAVKFAKALEANKERLMKLLNIDNDTYNKLARLAMAIAEQETNFGDMPVDSFGFWKPGITEVDTIGGNRNRGVVGGEYSFGMTQIKLGLWLNPEKEPELYKIFTENLNITKGKQLDNPENCALATLSILATINKRIQSPQIQDSMEAATGAVVSNEGWEMDHKTGILKKTYNTKPYVNKVTDEDAICYYWNNGGAAIRKGTAEPAGNNYTNNVRKYIKKYRIEENPADRARAAKEAEAKRQSEARKPSGNVSFTPMDNNGPMGSIIFLPMMYSDKPFNNKNEIQILKDGLAKNSKVQSSYKQLLISAVERHEIAFEYGLTEKEVASLTTQDVKRILSHLYKLTSKIERESNVRFSDGISSEEAKTLGSKFRLAIRTAEYEFKREYLGSLSKQVDLNNPNISKSNVVKLKNKNPSLSASRARRGFIGNVFDRGIDTSGTSAASAAFAKFAQRVSAKMTQDAISNGKQPGGLCMTGFRRAFINSGIADAIIPNSNPPKTLGSDLLEGKPRAAVRFFERHPDMFEEVKWIDLGNGKGRQINSTDLPKLPAGYIVIWVPDANFSEKEGHISVTNGNAQAYADESDNLDWGGYSGHAGKGKGEHGHFRVFRLNDKWTVGPDGKLVFNG